MKRTAVQNNSLSNRTQFDYPNTQAVQGYKNYIPDDQNPHIQTAQQKQRYKKFIKEQQQNERNKAKTNTMIQKEKQRQQKQKQLLEQLENKKKQLQELQRIRKQAIQQQKRAQQLAVLKTQQDQIRRIQQQQRAKENKHTANFRFVEALKRLEQDNKERDYKKSQAQLRRKVAQQTQKAQREKAIQYSAWADEKQRNSKSKPMPQFDQFKQPLGRAGFVEACKNNANNKSKDYSKSYSHNPKLLVAYRNLQSQENAAMEQALIVSQRIRESSAERERNSAQKRRRSLQRGRQATIKIHEEKQFKEYCKDAEQKSFEYNMSRIQAAKRNQFIGIKPATLQQMEANKRIRSDQQFKKTFLEGNNPQWQASKHEMKKWRENNTHKQNESSGSQRQIIIKKYNVPLTQMDQGQCNTGRAAIKNLSNPYISNGKHYNNEQYHTGNIEELTSVKKYQQNDRLQYLNGTDQQEDLPRAIPVKPRVIIYDHKDLGQTVSGTKQLENYNINTDLGDSLQQMATSPDFKHKSRNSNQKKDAIKQKQKQHRNQRFDQLEYSQSEQDSSYFYR